MLKISSQVKVLVSNAKCFICNTILIHIHKPSLLTDTKHCVTLSISCSHHSVETACCYLHMHTPLTKLKYMHDMCFINSEDPTIFTQIWDNPPSQSSVLKKVPNYKMFNFEVFILLGCSATCVGYSLLTFQDSPSVPPSRVKQSNLLGLLDPWRRGQPAVPKHW